jgi:hypothetical protein
MQVPAYIIYVFLAVKYKLISHLEIPEKTVMRLLIVDNPGIISERLTLLSEVPMMETGRSNERPTGSRRVGEQAES